MTFDQIIIALTGCASAWMIHSTDKKIRLWACVFALVGQPAWFYAAWHAQQWGILVMDVVYTAGWIRGFLNNRRI
jgi:hypothetical protein